MVAAETIEMGRHRPLVAGRDRSEIDIIEPPLAGHGGDGGDQPLGQAGVILPDTERSGAVGAFGAGLVVVNEDQIEIG